MVFILIPFESNWIRLNWKRPNKVFIPVVYFSCWIYEIILVILRGTLICDLTNETTP